MSVTSWAHSVRLICTTAISESGTPAPRPGSAPTIDGVTPGLADVGKTRLLLTNQATPSLNGIWIYQGAGADMLRPTDDFNNGVPPATNVTVVANEGATYANSSWRLLTIPTLGHDIAIDATTGQAKDSITSSALGLMFVKADTTVNVKLFGAVGNAQGGIDGSISVGSLNTLNSASSAFTADSVPAGTPITVFGAGPSGADLVTTATYASATSLTLATPASAAPPTDVIFVLGTDDQPALALAAAAGVSHLVFPPGVFLAASSVTFPETMTLKFLPGAMLLALRTQITIEGPVEADPLGQIFHSAGTGYRGLPATGGTSPPTVTWNDPAGSLQPYGTFQGTTGRFRQLKILIVGGGNLGTMTFQYSRDNGTSFSEIVTSGGNSMTAWSFTIPCTGVTLTFSPGTYNGANSSPPPFQNYYTCSFFAPYKVTLPNELTPQSWGAKGNGVADDTPAMASVFDALQPNETLWIPGGIYLVTSTLVLQNLTRVQVVGENATLNWGGGFDETYTNPIPLLDLQSLVNCTFRSFTITASSNRLAEGIRLSTMTVYPQLSNANTFHEVCVDGDVDSVELCVRIGSGAVANNDMHAFYNCVFENYGNAGVEVQDGTNIVMFVGCQIFGGEVSGVWPSVANGSISAGTNTLTIGDTTTFGIKDAGDGVVGKWIEVTCVDSSILRARVGSVTVGMSSTTIDLVDQFGNPRNATVNAGPNATVRYGSQCSVRAGALFKGQGTESGLGGCFTWIGGMVGSNIGADFFISGNRDQAITIRDCPSEQSRKYLFGYSGAGLVVLEGCNPSGAHTIAEDPNLIDFLSVGADLHVRDCVLGGLDGSENVAVSWGAQIEGPQLVMEGSVISSGLAYAAVFPSQMPTRAVATFVSLSGVRRRLVSPAPLQQVSGVGKVYFRAYDSYVVELIGHTTIAIDFTDALGVEKPVTGLAGAMRMFLRQASSGPFQLAWPANVVWVGDGPPVVPLGEIVSSTSNALCVVDLSYEENYAYSGLSSPQILARVVGPTLVENASSGTTKNVQAVFPIPIGAITSFILEEIEICDVDAGDNATWYEMRATYSRSVDGSTITPRGSAVFAGSVTTNELSTSGTGVAPTLSTAGATSWRVYANYDTTNHNLPIQVENVPSGARIRIRARVNTRPGVFDPTQLVNLSIWVIGDTGIHIGTGVSQWDDQSGNNHHLIQGTAANQPVLVSGDFNGHDTVRFDGIDDYMGASFTQGSSGGTYFLVYRMLGVSAVSNQHDAIFDGTTGTCALLEDTANGTRMFNGTALVDAAVEANNIFALATAVFDGSASSLRIGGKQVAAGSAGGPATAGGLTLGSVAGGTSSRCSNVEIAEVVVYDRVLTGLEIFQVESYLESKYSI